MIQSNFKDCCHSCVERETYVKEHKFYGENIVQTIETIIGCEHEKVCYKYEREKAEEFIGDVFKIGVDLSSQDDISKKGDHYTGVNSHDLEKMNPEELSQLGFYKLKEICQEGANKSHPLDKVREKYKKKQIDYSKREEDDDED